MKRFNEFCSYCTHFYKGEKCRKCSFSNLREIQLQLRKPLIVKMSYRMLWACSNSLEERKIKLF